MKKELIDSIINALIESTFDGVTEWMTSSMGTDSEKYYESYTIDQKTKFTIKISLDDHMNMRSDGWDYLSINNESIRNDREFFYAKIFPEVTKLTNLIYQKYIKATITIIDEESIYKDILHGIGDKQYNRDKKLSSLLGDDDQKDDQKDESGSFLKRIFGK